LQNDSDRLTAYGHDAEGIPQGLKPEYVRAVCGTAEAVPFQNRSKREDYRQTGHNLEGIPQGLKPGGMVMRLRHD